MGTLQLIGGRVTVNSGDWLVRLVGVGLSRELSALIAKAAQRNHQLMSRYMREAALAEAERLMVAIPLDSFVLNGYGRDPIGAESVSIGFWTEDKERLETVCHLLHKPPMSFIRDATVTRLAKEGYLGPDETSAILHDIKLSRSVIVLK